MCSNRGYSHAKDTDEGESPYTIAVSCCDTDAQGSRFASAGCIHTLAA